MSDRPSIVGILNRDRIPSSSTCKCRDCDAAINQAHCHDGFMCGNCGFSGRPVALACLCRDEYDDLSSYREPLRVKRPHNDLNCLHGTLSCPVCQDGEGDVDPWRIIREIREAIRQGALAR